MFAGRKKCISGPSCSKHCWLNELVNDNLVIVVAKVFSNTLIFLLHFSAKKKINVFAIFQDRHFNLTLANNFVKF